MFLHLREFSWPFCVLVSDTEKAGNASGYIHVASGSHGVCFCKNKMVLMCLACELWLEMNAVSYIKKTINYIENMSWFWGTAPELCRKSGKNPNHSTFVLHAPCPMPDSGGTWQCGVVSRCPPSWAAASCCCMCSLKAVGFGGRGGDGKCSKEWVLMDRWMKAGLTHSCVRDL